MTRRELIELIDWLEGHDLDRWVEEGLLTRHAAGEATEFEEADVARLELIRELRRDFEVNEEALPVVLHLVDQVHTLRRTVRVIGEGLAEESEEVRVRIQRRVVEREGAD